ncbi:MAG TPA: ABC transporter substrate-binding protein [Acidimicrobiales bacterium]|jgi:peptide/nickel transport system substrate-binding protein
MSCTYFSVDNINQFENLMYRPLYWFGLGASAAVVDKSQSGASAADGLSLAAAPVFSNGNKTVTLNMGNYVFQDGQKVNAQSVEFFLNLYHSDPSAYCGYVPGYGIPDQVSSVTSPNNSTVVINFSKAVNPNWLLYNYLSEITPFPDAWDVSAANTPSTCASGTYGAAATDTACKAVVTYLQTYAQTTSDYTNNFWQSGTDGPYELTAFDNLGNATLVPNTTYAGPQKSQVSQVQLLAYTSATAEANDLRSGKVDLGYIDTSYLSKNAPAPGKVGPNWSAISGNYNIVASAGDWGMDYAQYNFNPKNPYAKYLNQGYIRQALQDGVNQVGIISKLDKGYGLVTDSPLPNSATAAVGVKPKDLNPYNISKAGKLLSSHGWKKVKGALLCEKPGTAASDCGKGISKGNRLTIRFEYGTGTPAFTSTVETMLSAWSSLGIKTAQIGEPFNSVISDCAAHATNWDVCDWGAGWIYAPDYYPSGEWGFVPGASFNIGDYNNPTMTSIINTTTFGTASLTKYALYFEQQLPVLFQPNAFTPAEIKKTVGVTAIGFTPNPLQNFNPEYFYFKS